MAKFKVTIDGKTWELDAKHAIEAMGTARRNFPAAKSIMCPQLPVDVPADRRLQANDQFLPLFWYQEAKEPKIA